MTCPSRRRQRKRAASRKDRRRHRRSFPAEESLTMSHDELVRVRALPLAGQSLYVSESWGDYDAYIWPSALVMSRFLIIHRSRFEDAVSLEIGAGTALPSLVLCRIGAPCIIVTDKLADHSCNFRASLAHNHWLQRLGGQIHIISLDWLDSIENGKMHSALASRRIDYILGADVFYDPVLFEPCLRTVFSLLDRFGSSNAAFITTYQERSSSFTLTPLLAKYNLKVIDIIYGRDLLDTLDSSDDSTDPDASASVEEANEPHPTATEINWEPNGIDSVWIITIGKC